MVLSSLQSNYVLAAGLWVTNVTRAAPVSFYFDDLALAAARWCCFRTASCCTWSALRPPPAGPLQLRRRTRILPGALAC